jgi:hypothetical protein
LQDPNNASYQIFKSLSKNQQKCVKEFTNLGISSKRRTHALVGQSLLVSAHLTTIQQRHLLVVLVTKFYEKLDLFSIQDFQKFIVSTPENFDDLEDDDHNGDDFTSHPYESAEYDK